LFWPVAKVNINIFTVNSTLTFTGLTGDPEATISAVGELRITLTSAPVGLTASSPYVEATLNDVEYKFRYVKVDSKSLFVSYSRYNSF